MTPSIGEMPKILRWIFGGAGLIIIAGGTAYFFGRIYLDAYYDWFGLSEGILVFSTYEYMYHSFPIFMMLIPIVGWIPLYYRLWKKGQYTLIDTTKPLKKQIDSIIWEIGNGVVSILVVLWFFIFDQHEIFGSIAYTGLIIGFFGMMLYRFIFTLLIWQIDSSKKPDEIATSSNIRMAVFIVILLVILPIYANQLGKIGAISEFDNLAQVTIVANDLPNEMEPSESGNFQSSDVKMLIINNDIAYVFKSAIGTNVKRNKQIAFNGGVYAIKLSDIKYLIYYGERE